MNVYGIITVNCSMRSGGTGRPVAKGFQGLKSEGYTLPSFCHNTRQEDCDHRSTHVKASTGSIKVFAVPAFKGHSFSMHTYTTLSLT